VIERAAKGDDCQVGIGIEIGAGRNEILNEGGLGG